MHIMILWHKNLLINKENDCNFIAQSLKLVVLHQKNITSFKSIEKINFSQIQDMFLISA